MNSRMTRLCAIAAAAALAASLVPAVGSAAPRDLVAAKASRDRGLRAAALTAGSATYAPDPNDSTDDTWTAAFDVAGTLGLPRFTGSYETTARAFYKGDVASGGGAEDWWSFSVDASDVASGATYLFEAKTSRTTVDPIIEVYRADGDGVIYPTPADQLVGARTDLSLGTSGAVAANDDPGGAISRWIYDKGRTLPAGKTDWLTDVHASGEQPGAILRSYVFGGAGTVSGAVLRDLDHITGPGPLL